MILCWGKLWKVLFSIRPQEVTFARRGFRAGDPGARRHLEQVGRTFLDGYHAALEETELGNLVTRLGAIEPESRSFAFEGAAMGLCLLDWLLPGRRAQLPLFLKGPGSAHAYMVHVGVGWTAARLGGRVELLWKPLDPFLRWLAVDGYGFHEGYFHWRRYVPAETVPAHLRGYGRQVFDQGLGRSLWFVFGADVSALATVLGQFPLSRRPELWSGLGLACAYAGGVADGAIQSLLVASGIFQAQFAQGVAFAAKARQRAGNPADHTDLTCRVVCGLPAEEAAHVTDTALENLGDEGSVPAFEVWRRRIQKVFAR